MDTTKLSAIFTKLNFFKDILKQSDNLKVIAVDDAINECRRDNRFPWTIQKNTLKIFKDILYYSVANGHDSLLTLNKKEVDSYSDAASYFNTDLNQFIEMVKRQRNLLTQTYIGGSQVLGVRNIQEEIIQSILDTAGDPDTYSAVSNATKVGLNNVYTLNNNKSISFNLTGSPAEIKNTYSSAQSIDNYLEKYYIRRIYLKSIPTNIELRVQTSDDNYLSKTLTEQVTGLPFVANDFNYIGFPFEEGEETGAFDNESIASSKIIPTGYSGIMYISYDSIDEFLLQQYWFYSKFLVVSDGSSSPDKEQFLDYDSNDFDPNDELLGPTKWIDTIIKKARKQLLLGIENEYLRNSVSKTEKRATDEFDRNFPNQEPKLTTVRRRFNNNPEEMNYVP
jgi:hypothetical protein